MEIVSAGYQATHLFESEETDYMFSSISDYSEEFYEKNTKSYDEICQDYIMFAHHYVRIFMVATPDTNVSQILSNFSHIS